MLIRAWREINYPDYHAKDGETPTSKRTANQFLIDFDFKYWLRRLTFIRSKIDDLLRLDETGTTSGTAASGRRAATIERLGALKFNPLEYEKLSDEERGQFQAVVAYLKFQEEMPPATQEQLGRLLSEALIRASSGEPFEDALVKVMGPLQSDKVKKRMETAMRACLASRTKNS